MHNLYFKIWSMSSFSKKFSWKHLILWVFAMLFFFWTHAFAQTKLYFSPGNVYPILNTDDSVRNNSKIKINWSINVSLWYGVDILNNSILWHPNDKLSTTSLVTLNVPSGITVDNNFVTQSRDGDPVWYFNGRNTSASTVNFTDSHHVGNLKFNNSGAYYLTSVSMNFYTGNQFATKINNNPYDSLSWLNIYFRACPSTRDSVAPTFPNNSSTLQNSNFPHRQTNRQYRDEFSWIFGLLDNTNPTTNNNGREWTPDFDWWSNFRPRADTPTYSGGITNQNGINSWSFVLQIKVANGWDHSTAQTSWSSWATTDTLTNAQVPLTAWGKTWRYLDKNYTWDIDTVNISDFDVEELVMISGYVEDRNMGYAWFNGTQTWDQIKWYSYRSGKNSYSFVYYFNQGMRPWFNTSTQGSYTHNVACILDLDQHQSGFVIRTITGYLHDDRAGIDTTSVQVIVTGTINWVETSTTYDVGDVSNLDFTQFNFTDDWCRIDWTTTSACTLSSPGSCGNTASVYPGNGSTEVCDDGSKQSTGNYRIVFNDTTKKYNPETKIYVSIVYADNAGKQWRPVACNRWVKKKPRFVWFNNILDMINSLLGDKVVLSNYPQGWQVQPITIQLQDDWAGVATGSIIGSVNWQTLNAGLDDISGVNINLAYDSTLYTQVSWSDLWNFDTYPNTTTYGLFSNLYNGQTNINYIDRLLNPINDIHSRQKINYELLFAQTGINSNFTGYFAPEYPINLTLSFTDLEWETVHNPINITYENNEAPEFWEHTKTTNFTWWTDQLISSTTPIGNYLTGEMAKLFSGDTDMRRIFPYDLTGDNLSEIWDIKQTDIALRTTDNRAGIDSGSVTVTVTWNRRWMPYTYVFTASNLLFEAFNRWDEWARNELNYIIQLKNHDIYFDRQSRWWSAPVVGRESRYTVTLQADDLKQPNGNRTTASFTRDMENLSCQFLDRCNARLYFTYAYSGVWQPVSPVVQTWVHPFLWQTLYVIASGNQVIFTWTSDNYIACNGAWTLTSPIQIAFQAWLLAWGETTPYTNYQHSELMVMDGMFVLSGDDLIIQ